MKKCFLFTQHGRNDRFIRETVRIFESEKEFWKYAVNFWKTHFKDDKPNYGWDGIIGATIDENGMKSIRNFEKNVYELSRK